MIIAIDGPAGSGKSSTAREVAERLDYLHVDSGAFYRALTYALLEHGVPEAEWDELGADRLDALEVRGERGGRGLRMRVGADVVDRELRTDAVNDHVSHVARIPGVREWLLGRLRRLAEAEDVVVDGRDIGTAVFPDAALKIFLVADPEVRARRRLREEGVDNPDRDTLLGAIDRLRERDRQDREREVAPLRAAGDAVRVDTTALTFDEQVAAILELASARAAVAAARPPGG
ncbi:MAG: (d)CMP kinase [Candidatus Longimicrobiales bacterium M2_2A_002]